MSKRERAISLIASIKCELAELEDLLGGASQAPAAAVKTPAAPADGKYAAKARARALDRVKLRDGRVGPKGEFGVTIEDPPDSLAPGVKVLVELKDGRTFPKVLQELASGGNDWATWTVKGNTPIDQWTAPTALDGDGPPPMEG